jgi:hypothetical protein
VGCSCAWPDPTKAFSLCRDNKTCVFTSQTFASGAAGSGGGKEGFEELLDVLGMAVVRVKGHEDIVALRQEMHGLGKNNGTEGHILHRSTGSKFTATRGNLNDAVGLGLRKGLERTVDRGEGSHIDRRISITAFLGGIEHGTVLSGGSDGHLVVCVFGI